MPTLAFASHRSTNENLITAGADLKDIAELDTNKARSCRFLEDLCSGLTAVRKPLLAAMNGPAVCPTQFS